jgi:hypothetical protein
MMLGAAALLAIALPSAAQTGTPHAGYVYPAGGKQGSTFEVTVGGQYLDGVATALVSGAGVEAKVLKHTKPVPFSEYQKIRDQWAELSKRRAAAYKERSAGGQKAESETAKKIVWTAEDDKKLLDAGIKLRDTVAIRAVTPSIGETVTVQVSVAPGAEPGEREFRLVTRGGLTNPMIFFVGQLPEISRKPLRPTSVYVFPKYASQMKYVVQTGPTKATIALPVVVNGQIAPGGADRYHFKATKGQHLVIAAMARELIPYISDAVPGWFQATLTLYDSAGKQLDYADHYRFHPDPVLYDEIPADGEYTVEVRDSIYRGREDFVYRVAIGELPYATSVFPLGAKAGSKTSVELKGWNLPQTKVTEDAKGKAAGVYPVSAPKNEAVFNRLPFAVDTLPEIREKEPNNQIEKAQKIKLPVIVNGRIGQPGDWDVFRFEGRAGDEIVAEVFARRLDSPLDSILKLTDAAGKVLAINDDHDDRGAGLVTFQADSRIDFKLPAKGTYYLQLGDTQGKGGAEYGYRLRVAPPKPDFELRVVPSSLSVRAGMTVPITVHALRRDGFAGPITLKLKDAPAGFQLSGAMVPANQDKVRLTLTAPPAKIDLPFDMRLEGRATIQGREVVHAGVPAEDMEQAFAYHHLVASGEWLVRVVGNGQRTIAWKLPAGDPVKLRAGDVSPVQISGVLGTSYAAQVQVTLNDPPDGVSIQKATSDASGVSVLVKTDAGKAKPGLRGNLIVDAFMNREYSPGQGKTPVKIRVPLGTLPAIPFEVVGTEQARQ